MKLGIFGGTFDPPHIGHLIVADDALAALGLDRILFVPAGTHPLKGDKVAAPTHLRLRMIRAAVGDAERFAVDDREIRRVGPSYTVDTLAELEEEYPGSELYLLVGSDIMNEIHRWHRVPEIAARARIAVMSRADAPKATASVAGLQTIRVEVTHVAISSSEIRERVTAGRPFRYLVPEGVYEIIAEHALYRKQRSD
jgi:nicotinate-nucleotide adenylyltransferase